MFAKVIYFNWHKAQAEDNLNPGRLSLMHITWTGEILAHRLDLYDCVGDVNIELPHEQLCGHVYRQFNRVEEGDMEGMTIRSMSVGDIVMLDDYTMFVCQPMGWRKWGKISSGVDKSAFWNLPKVKEQKV